MCRAGRRSPRDASRRSIGGCFPTTPNSSRPPGWTGTPSTPTCAPSWTDISPTPATAPLAEEHVGRFGALVGEVIAPRAEVTDKHGPVLRRYDRWGEEVDEVVHHPNWTQNKADLVRNGFVSLEALAGRPVPGVVTASVSYLVSQAETAIYCGLGMTSGAADIVERYAPAAARDDLLGRLRNLDPDEAWEGGMFLTERQGGSDVGANTTRAVQDGDEWLLSGEKHFCSNVDAEVFIVLARPDGAPAGSRGLATYIVPRILPDGSANGFRIKRLKPKLGTVGVPTGEVSLDGARAWLAGGSGALDAGAESSADAARDGRGINRMMEMVNGSRFGVALMGLGIHRRSFLEAAIYAARRSQFGNRIDSYPLVRETLVDMLVDLEAGMAATYECAAAARGRPGRRIGPAGAAHPRAPGQDALHPHGAVGGVDGARGPGRQRVHGGLAHGPPAAGRPVPHHLGGHREHPVHRRPPGHARRAGPRRPAGPGGTGARDGLGPQGARRRARHRGRIAARHPAGDLLPRDVHPTTWPCSTAGASPSSSPTPWRVPSSSRKPRGPSTATATPARRRWPDASSAGGWPPPPLRGITDPDRSVLDLFEPLVRYGSIDESDLAA